MSSTGKQQVHNSQSHPINNHHNNHHNNNNSISSSPIVTSSSFEKKSWMTETFSRRSATLLPTTPSFMNKPLNKLHQAIAARDLAKVKQRLAQPRKAKVEMLELDHMDQTPLCAALRLGCYDIVKDLLCFIQANKMDINQQDKNGYTPLHVAASNCDDQILMLLLREEGINVNLINDDKNSALHYFCQKFKSPNLTEPFNLFLKKGVNVNLQNKNGETPLHKSIFNNSVRLLMVNFLLENGAEVNVLNSRGESPLHFAVRLGREDLVSVLVKAGADPNVKGNEKKTCYELSLQGQNVKVINFLKNVQDVHKWLSSIELGEYWLNFVKEEIFMDLLPDVDENTLDSLQIKPNGHRIKIIKQCRILKEKQAHEQSENNNNQQNYNQQVKATNRSMESLKSNTPNSVSGSFESAGSISSDELKETLSSLDNFHAGGSSYIIHHNELEYTCKLGAGSSGKVYKGIYRGREVAIKVLKAFTTQSQLEEFKKEFQIMASIRSPYMVSLHGASLDPKLCMVIEYCSRDSLYHVMNTKKYDIGWDRFFQFTMQMTLGIQHLHNYTPQIVHRDFKSLNLLVNEDWECKVSDFGLSRFNTADNLETLSKIRGTFAYCSPEVANGSGSPYTTKSDIYSIGIVFWELLVRVLTGEYSRPYSEYTHIKMDFQIMLNSKEGLRPTLPAQCPQGLVTLYLQCVHQEAANRPSCEDIIAQLNLLRNEYLLNRQQWDQLIRKTNPLVINNNNNNNHTTNNSNNTTTSNHSSFNNNNNNNNNTSTTSTSSSTVNTPNTPSFSSSYNSSSNITPTSPNFFIAPPHLTNNLTNLNINSTTTTTTATTTKPKQ